MRIKEAKSIESEPGLENNTNTALLSRELGIREIQQEAIRYAEVYPEKIANWRKQARIKALMPELTLDYDKTVTTALGATYDRVQVGPRDWGLLEAGILGI